MAKVLSQASTRVWTNNADPGLSETNVEQGNFWLNTSTGNLFVCADPTGGAQIWNVSGFVSPLSTSAGGTGLSGLTAHKLVVGNGSSAATLITPSATSGVPLISQGASSDPTYGTAVVAGGGTGATTLTGVLTGNGTSAVTANAVTQHSVVVGGASNAVGSTSVGATGTVLIGNTGADPTFSAAPTLTSVTFGAGTALSTYVQGTFIPALTFGGGNTGITYNTQVGKYTQIGNIVYFLFRIFLTNKGSSTGAASITGFPVASYSGQQGACSCIYQSLTLATYSEIGLQMNSGATTATLIASSAASSQVEAALTDTSFANGTVLDCSGFYFTS